jgi:hypothetical protein
MNIHFDVTHANCPEQPLIPDRSVVIVVIGDFACCAPRQAFLELSRWTSSSTRSRSLTDVCLPLTPAPGERSAHDNIVHSVQ